MEIADRAYKELLGKFDVDGTGIIDSEHWGAFLRSRQITLGALVLIPATRVADFGDLTPNQASDLFGLVATCQGLLRSSFQADRFNLVAAMMKDPFVHFHLIPRYEATRSFAQAVWSDDDWPALVSFSREPHPSGLNGAVLTKLRSAALSLPT